MKDYKRGDIFYANLGEPRGCVQGGNRPVVIVQNDVGNAFSPTVQVVPMTSSRYKANLPTHVHLYRGMGGLERDSMVMTEQATTVNKIDLGRRIGRLSDNAMDKIDRALAVSFGLAEEYKTR